MHACMEATRMMLTCAQPQADPEQLHRLVILTQGRPHARIVHISRKLDTQSLC